MARSMTGVAAGRVNTRYLLLAFILAIISGVLAYAAVSRSGDGGGSSAVAIDVVVAREPVEVGQQLTAGVLAIRELPADAVGEDPVTSIEAIEGRQALVPIAPGEPVLSSKVVGTGVVATNDALAFVIEEGQRGMAVTVDQVSSAGGLVLPGDHVDIFWAPGDQAEIPQDHEGAMLIGENVEVLAVQQELVDISPTTTGAEGEEAEAEEPAPSGERVRDAAAEAQPEATTVTLLLNPAQAARVFCAESSGSIRLAVRQFGDETPSGLPPAICVIPATEEQQAQPQP